MSRPSDPSTNDADDLRDVDLTAWAPPPAPPPDVAQIVALAAGTAAVEAPAPASTARRAWRYLMAGGLVIAAAAATVWLVVEARREPAAVSAQVAPGRAAEPRVGSVAPPAAPPSSPPALTALPDPGGSARDDAGALEHLRTATTSVKAQRDALVRQLADVQARLEAAQARLGASSVTPAPRPSAAATPAALEQALASTKARLAAAQAALAATEATLSSSAPTPCNYEALLQQTKDAFANAEYRKSLGAAERAIACNRSAAEPKKFALIAACKLHDKRAFDRYYPAAKTKLAFATLAGDCLDFLPTE